MIRRKPVPNQPRLALGTEPQKLDGKGKPEDAKESPEVQDAADAVPRKPLSPTGTDLGKTVRGLPDLTFVWGVKSQPSLASEFFFFMSYRGISSSTLPLSLRKLAKELNPSKIKRILAATVGPEEDCFAAWQDHNDEYRWILRRSAQPSKFDKAARRKWLTSRQSITELDEWLSRHLSNPFAVLTARVVLGPEGSYFASHLELSQHDNSPEVVATWNKLPASLLELRHNRDVLRGPEGSVPILIVLGVDNAWVVVWSNREASWDLGKKYEGLARQLEARDGIGIENVFLSAVEEEQYYIQFTDRAAYLSAPILQSDLELINACLISSFLNPNDAPTSPTAKSLINTPGLETPSRIPPLLPPNQGSASPQLSADEPIIIPAALPGVLNISVISDRDFHSPFVSFPTIPPIPRSKLKFVHFAKAPESVRDTWKEDSVSANLREASNCPMM